MEGTALPVRTRIFAVVLELLPLAGLLLLAGGPVAPIGLLLLLATGSGWALTGRVGTGCVVALFRLAIMVLAIIPATAYAFRQIDCYPQCDVNNEVLAASFLVVPLVLTTLVSALFVANTTTRGS